MTNTDSMSTARARWIGATVAWNWTNNHGSGRATGRVIDWTPAELRVECLDDSGRVWITPDVDGFERLDVHPVPDAADEPELAVGDPITWTPYVGSGTTDGFVERLGQYESPVVRRESDGSLFRVAINRIQHRAVAAPSATFAGADRKSGVKITATPGGVVFAAYDNVTGQSVEVTFGFGATAEITAWLTAQMHDPANDYSAR